MSMELIVIIIITAALVVFGLVLFLTNITGAGHEASHGESAKSMPQPPGGDESIMTGSEFQSSSPPPPETAEAEAEEAPEEAPGEQAATEPGSTEPGSEFSSPAKS